MNWRVVITDTEQPSGVAPVCPEQLVPGSPHDVSAQLGTGEAPRYDEFGVYDCCPGPHLEVWSSMYARLLAEGMTSYNVEVCS